MICLSHLDANLVQGFPIVLVDYRKVDGMEMKVFKLRWIFHRSIFYWGVGEGLEVKGFIVDPEDFSKLKARRSMSFQKRPSEFGDITGPTCFNAQRL